MIMSPVVRTETAGDDSSARPASTYRRDLGRAAPPSSAERSAPPAAARPHADQSRPVNLRTFVDDVPLIVDTLATTALPLRGKKIAEHLVQLQPTHTVQSYMSFIKTHWDKWLGEQVEERKQELHSGRRVKKPAATAHTQAGGSATLSQRQARTPYSLDDIDLILRVASASSSNMSEVARNVHAQNHNRHSLSSIQTYIVKCLKRYGSIEAWQVAHEADKREMGSTTPRAAPSPCARHLDYAHQSHEQVPATNAEAVPTPDLSHAPMASRGPARSAEQPRDSEMQEFESDTADDAGPVLGTHASNEQPGLSAHPATADATSGPELVLEETDQLASQPSASSVNLSGGQNEGSVDDTVGAEVAAPQPVSGPTEAHSSGRNAGDPSLVVPQDQAPSPNRSGQPILEESVVAELIEESSASQDVVLNSSIEKPPPSGRTVLEAEREYLGSFLASLLTEEQVAAGGVPSINVPSELFDQLAICHPSGPSAQTWRDEYSRSPDTYASLALQLRQIDGGDGQLNFTQTQQTQRTRQTQPDHTDQPSQGQEIKLSSRSSTPVSFRSAPDATSADRSNGHGHTLQPSNEVSESMIQLNATEEVHPATEAKDHGKGQGPPDTLPPPPEETKPGQEDGIDEVDETPSQEPVTEKLASKQTHSVSPVRTTTSALSPAHSVSPAPVPTVPRSSRKTGLTSFWGRGEWTQPQARSRSRANLSRPIRTEPAAKLRPAPNLPPVPATAAKEKGRDRARSSSPWSGSGSSLTPPPELPKRPRRPTSRIADRSSMASEPPVKRARRTSTSSVARSSKPRRSGSARDRQPPRAQNVAAFQQQARGLKEDYGMTQRHMLYWLGEDMDISLARDRIEALFIERLQENCDLRRADLARIFADVKGDPVAFDERLAREELEDDQHGAAANTRRRGRVLPPQRL